MELSPKKLKTFRWIARSISLAVICFGLPFYFGYGNPLPFINPKYSAWDNMWLSIFPLMFLGLILGWKYEKAGGYLVCVPLTAGLLLGLLMQGELVVHMLIPLAAGLLYLLAGHQKVR